MEINDNTINETCNCCFDFECLKNEEKSCLSNMVETLIGNKVLFVKCNQNNCSYRMNYGNGIICKCPVRKEIHIKYNK
jgi:hypothetical protein